MEGVCVSLKNLEICSDDGSGQVGDVDADFAIRIACQAARSRDQGGGCSAGLERASTLQLLELVVTPLSGRSALKIQPISIIFQERSRLFLDCRFFPQN